MQRTIIERKEGTLKEKKHGEHRLNTKRVERKKRAQKITPKTIITTRYQTKLPPHPSPTNTAQILHRANLRNLDRNLICIEIACLSSDKLSGVLAIFAVQNRWIPEIEAELESAQRFTGGDD